MEYLAMLIYNNQGQHNPYHNTYHNLCVARACYEGGCAEGLDMSSLKNLVIAAIFHDIHHKGCMGNDNENIVMAVSYMERSLLGEDRERFDEIKSIIEATEFPFKVPGDQLTLPQQIIRDADMISLFQDNWLQQVMLGLASEYKKDLEVFTENNIQFVSSIKFLTNWGKKLGEEKIPHLLEQFKILKDMAVYHLY